MRILLFSAALAAVVVTPLAAQDPGQFFAQQAAQATMDTPTVVPSPRFSLKAGTYPGPVTLTLKRPRGLGKAKIFYTIGDWTPTAQSTLYTGPIQIDRSETVSAVVLVGKKNDPGLVGHVSYVLPAPVANTQQASLPGAVSLPAGTSIPVAFTSALDSKTATAGQALPLTLAADLIVNHKLIAAKGTAVMGTLLAVQPARHFERPGSLTVRVDTLELPGRTIALTGTEVKDGPLLGIKKNFLGFLFPPAGIAVISQHGAEAEIAPGAELTATLSTATSLTPAP